jgi:hypothetical protein
MMGFADILKIFPIQQRATVADRMDVIDLFAQPDHALYLAVLAQRVGCDESGTALVPLRGVSTLPEVPSPPIRISADSL